MGFLSAMKGANNSWGMCTSTDFNGPCYLGPKNLVNNSKLELMISGTGLAHEYVFTGKDVQKCEVRATGGYKCTATYGMTTNYSTVRS